ncbi:hypothetical protein BJX63DRAFT_406849 [Aspergillus granulosus]|uniref:Uncharacterized protein n=1 Tax=Aspergillus granulosus TaxID=176169 RepID=A0ABR4H0V5_9EURO
MTGNVFHSTKALCIPSKLAIKTTELHHACKVGLDILDNSKSRGDDAWRKFDREELAPLSPARGLLREY